MAITSDWHIHTHCSDDSACMEFETLVEEAKKIGLTDFGVSDHYHFFAQEPDIAASRKEFDLTLERHPELKGHFHFGIETTLMYKRELEKAANGRGNEILMFDLQSEGYGDAELAFGLDQAFLEKYGIAYFIAGTHWPMYCKLDAQSVLAEYHRQYMYCATHPFTDILAHFGWWDANLFRGVWGVKDMPNPFTHFAGVSQTMRSELTAALKENRVAFELNDYIFCDKNAESYRDEYLGFAADLQNSGVLLSMGSDCHAARLTDSCDYVNRDAAFRHYGIDPAKFFCL